MRGNLYAGRMASGGIGAEEMVVVATAGGMRVALPASGVRTILAIAPLWRPPTLPPVIAGFLRMAAHALPILDGARLLGRPSPALPGLHAHILILPALGGGVLVERAEQAVAVPASAWTPVAASESLNGCAVATAELGGVAVHLLAMDRLLSTAEAAKLADLTAQAAARMADWDDAA